MTLVLNSVMLTGAMAVTSEPKVDTKVRTEMLVSTQWLADHLKDKDVVVLCVAGSPDFYSEGHIPGARLLKVSDIVTKRGYVPNELPSVEQLTKVFNAASVSKGTRIVLYSDEYNLFATRAYYTLDYLGLADHVALLDGGINKWKNEVRPMVKSLAEDAPANASGLAPDVNQNILVDISEMRTIANTKNHAALLDARPRAEYSGERHSADVHKLGHIPGAQSLYWQDLLVSRENPVLLPPNELRKKFEAAGAAPGKEVITYCRSGMQSSFDYFVAKYLGYSTRMFDGSFIEWSNEDLPSETSK
jgi:thiosulfate/3-mercaptopyruvate sulfurtransferase